MSEDKGRDKPRHSFKSLAAVLCLGLLSGYFLGGVGQGWFFRKVPAQAQADSSQKKSMYQCPMHLQIIQDHPGTCPICGMDLVLMGSEETPSGKALDGHTALTIDSERQQLIGLKTVKVEPESLSSEIKALGRVVADETRVRRINVKVEGFVEKLFVDYVGKRVEKNEPLFALYSPEFISAQNEYLLALKTQKALSGSESNGLDLVQSARKRLALWDVPAESVKELENTGQVPRTVTLRSPIAGIVTAKNIVEGGRVSPAEFPFEIKDLNQIWVQVSLYENELGPFKTGMAVEVKLQAYPLQTFKGRVAFVDPVLDAKTRTVKLRLVLPNPKLLLKPEMYGEVTLKGASRKGLWVPQDAVLDAGEKSLVFIALGQGKFEPRVVKVGPIAGEKVEIHEGLQAGDEIVTRANFLVDSESRLNAAIMRMKEKSAPSGDRDAQ